MPSGENETPSTISETEVEKIRTDCLYAHPTEDKAIILSGMVKTAAARQQWIRNSQPSITEVLDMYPRLEDLPLDLVRFTIALCKKITYYILKKILMLGSLNITA